jgi:hypothetical protein
VHVNGGDCARAKEIGDCIRLAVSVGWGFAAANNCRPIPIFDGDGSLKIDRLASVERLYIMTVTVYIYR